MLFVYMAIAAALPTTPAASLTTPADVTITAVQLDTEYDQNVAAADAKYKGKIVEVTGVVERVADDLKKFRLTVELTGSIGSTVDCDFSTSDEAALSTLKPGATATIRGKCIGRRTIDGEKWVTLENCVIVPPESKTGTKPTGTKGAGTTDTKSGDGALKVAAGVLKKAFADNPVGANAKYGEKTLEVSGTVYVLDIGQPDTLYVWLGQKEKEIECRFKKGAAGVVSLNPKNAVVIRGKCTGDEDGLVVLEDCTLVK